MIRRPDHAINEVARTQTPVARFYTRWFWHSHEPGHANGSIELLLGHRKRGHGWGVVFGRNGSESDVGLDIYMGRALSMWSRFKSTHTTRFRDPNSYKAWHYGIRINRARITLLWRNDPMGSSRNNGRWTLSSYQIMGRTRSEEKLLDSGVCQIPMPEGLYPAEWKRDRHIRRHVGRLGLVRDRLLGPRISDPSYWVSVPGGIPVQGKGENSWDCGMDGIFGTGGRTLHDAIGNVVAAATRDRDRYGGPHHLTEPTSVKEASS